MIQIVDPALSKKSHISFSERDVFDARQIAKESPVTPIIVKKLYHKVSQKGYRVTESKQYLFKIARNILLDEERSHKIRGQWMKKKKRLSQIVTSINPVPETSPKSLPFVYEEQEKNEDPIPVQSIECDHQWDMASLASHPLFWVQYGHAIEELNTLFEIILNSGKIPILWRKAKGFIIDKIATHYALIDTDTPSDLKDPVKMIHYILNTPKDRIVYILEDFHHYIGGKETVNPHVGDVRSIIKELHDQFIKRSEHLIFYVPDFYEIPEELEPYVYTMSKRRYKKSKGYLDRFGQLLTDPNYIKKCKPVVGVDHLIYRMIQVLGQMESNNPLLVGSPGVGKTAVVEGFAKVLAKGDVIPQLRGRSLYSLSLNSMVAGTRYRGEFEIRLEGLMDEVLQNKDRIIVFIDEIHTLIDAGSTEGASGAGDVLKPVLARGEFPCIGATTPEGVTILSKDPALSRRFKKIWVKEPDVEETFRILKGISGNLESHHQLKVSDDALKAAVELSSKYIPDEFLPGKAVSLIDGTAAYCRMNGQRRVKREDILNEIERLKQLSFANNHN
nr:magnetosome protein Mad27-1 [Desulfobacteraceae bacterium]